MAKIARDSDVDTFLAERAGLEVRHGYGMPPHLDPPAVVIKVLIINRATNKVRVIAWL